MRIFLQKIAHQLVEVFPSEGETSKLKEGETYTAEIKLVRNLAFHRKFFALVKLGSINTKLEMPFEAYRKFVIMKAGFFETYKTGKGIMVLAKSIAFDNMSEEDFAELYSRVLDVIILDIGANKEIFEKELMSFI